MKILVTGGAGFIGSNIVDALVEKNHDVVVVDNLSTGKKEFINPKVKFYEIDITDVRLVEIFEQEKPEVVFHLAAQIDVRKSIDDPLFDGKVNILGSVNVLESARKAQVKKIIFSSTGGAIYGDVSADLIPTRETCLAHPIFPYGIAKLTVENYLHYYHDFFGLDYVILRYSNVYGPRQNNKGEAGVVAIFIDKILNNEQPVINGDGSQTRDFVFVADVVRANLLALDSKVIGTYNISTSKETNINELFQTIVKTSNSQIPEVHAPAKLGEQMRSCLDYSLVKEVLGWEPGILLREGIEMTFKWFGGERSKTKD
jgi:UDP-glucose 4-epimerase